MKKKRLIREFSVGSFNKYIVIVISIVALLLTKQFIVDYQLSRDVNQTKIINVAGRQRMLSQRICKDVYALYVYDDAKQRTIYLSELKGSVITWSSASDNLQAGKADEGLSGNFSQRIKEMYADIAPNLAAIEDAAHAVISIAESGDIDKSRIWEQIEIMEDNEAHYLAGMDAIVNQYDFESKENMISLRNIEWILMLVLLGVILVETLVIFWPHEKKLAKVFNDLDKSRNSFLKLFDVAPTAMLLLDYDTMQVRMLNGRAGQMFRDEGLEANPATFREILDIAPEKMNGILRDIKTNDKNEGIEINVNTGRERIVALLSSTKIDFEQRTCILIELSDITRQKQTEETFKTMANTDKLTNLYNRHYFDMKVLDEMERAEKENEPLSLIIFDIDLFKNVNDTFGHQVGDEVLKQTADVTSGLVRRTDSVARTGGEEFAILLPDTGLLSALKAAEKLRAAIEEKAHSIAGHYTCSFGVSEMKKGENLKNWFERADQALYAAKNTGRNRVVCSVDK